MLSLGEQDVTLVGKATATVKELAKQKDDVDPARVCFEIDGYELSKAQFNSLFSEPHAYDAVHNEKSAGQVEPVFRGIKAIEILGAMVGAYVRVASPLDQARKMFEQPNCKISRMRIVLANTALDIHKPVLSCKIEHSGGDASAIKALIEKLGKTVRVEIRGEQPGQQKDLPLNTFGSKGTIKREKVDTKKRRGGRPPTKTDSEDNDIGTPEQERQKSRTREQEIAQQLSAGRGKPN